MFLRSTVATLFIPDAILFEAHCRLFTSDCCCSRISFLPLVNKRLMVRGRVGRWVCDPGVQVGTDGSGSGRSAPQKVVHIKLLGRGNEQVFFSVPHYHNTASETGNPWLTDVRFHVLGFLCTHVNRLPPHWRTQGPL